MIQSMDQGNISSFKRHYKSKFMMELLKATNSSVDAVLALAKMFNLKDYVYSASESWEKIPKSA